MLMTINSFFKYGMKRELPDLITLAGRSLELGPGNSPIGADESLEYPDWDCDTCVIPFDDESFTTISMYHFLEHARDPIFVLRECERVLKKGGVINIVVPHQRSDLSYEDLDHKSFFAEHTIRKLLKNDGYEKNNGWELKQHICFIMAIELRNLSIFIQLTKGERI